MLVILQGIISPMRYLHEEATRDLIMVHLQTIANPKRDKVESIKSTSVPTCPVPVHG